MYIYNIVFRYFGCVCVCIELISRDVVYRTDVLNLILVSFGKSNQENIGEDFFLVVFFLFCIIICYSRMQVGCVVGE